MKKFSLILVAFACSGCTLSLTLANTHGYANDLVDSTPTTDTKTDADIKIPPVGL